MKSPPTSESNLHLDILQSLPTPILLLSSDCTAVFANHAAVRILGSVSPIQALGNGIDGRGLEELGVRIVGNEVWAGLLDGLREKEGETREKGREGAVDIVVDNSRLKAGERTFRVRIGRMRIGNEDERGYVLSFEKFTHLGSDGKGENEIRAAPVQEKSRSQNHTPSPPKRKDKKDSPPIPEINIPSLKRSIFESCSIPSFIISADESFYLYNNRARDLFGGFVDMASGFDGAAFRAGLKMWDETMMRELSVDEFPGIKLVRSGKPFSGVRYGLQYENTGKRIVMSVDGECLYDDTTGQFIGGICWYRELQEYSEYLLAQQQKVLESHETICDLMPHMVWTTTNDGLIDYFSKRWYDFTGLTKEESLGHAFETAVHPEDLPTLLEKFQIHNKDGTECQVEARYRRKDGIYRWSRVSASPLRDEQGKILKWYGTTTDVHDIIMQRIEARRNKKQMLTVLAHAEVNLFSIDKNRIITMAEGGMEWESETDIYDVTKKSTLIGQDAIEVARHTQPGGIPGYEKNILAILEGKVKMAQSEDKIGDRVFRTRVVAEMAHDTHDGAAKPVVKGVVGMSIDVTDMKARAALETHNSRLVVEEQAARDSNKMKSQFLANMSHELRTPTAGVIGMVELLSEDKTLSPGQREYVSSIQLSAKALLTIVNDILDFSKIESGRLDIESVPFNLSNVLDELCKLLSMFAQQKGLDFTYENKVEDELEVTGDPGRVRQVLSNLLTNALKFTHQGSVKLTVSATKINPQLIDDDTMEVTFVIADTGIGIEKNVLDKLFRPFSQGDSSTARLFGGTGLGLTISQHLANLMKGSICLESTPTKGSTATFKIPLKASNWGRKSPVFSQSPPNPGFKYYSRSSRSPAWTAPSFNQRAGNQALLNQQISNSVTSYVSPGGVRQRHDSIDATIAGSSGIEKSEELSMEMRKEIHVLVVEDNAINQTIAIRNIRNLGFPVTAVWNGQEALNYLLSPSSTQPRPSIILMDVQMPVMDGYEATRILRTDQKYTSFAEEESPPNSPTTPTTPLMIPHQQNDTSVENKENDTKKNNKRPEVGPRGRSSRSLGGKGRLRDIPVIAMTASAIQGDREKCHEAGMDDYLAKPVEKERLEEMLIRWAGRRRG